MVKLSAQSSNYSAVIKKPSHLNARSQLCLLITWNLAVLGLRFPDQQSLKYLTWKKSASEFQKMLKPGSGQGLGLWVA